MSGVPAAVAAVVVTLTVTQPQADGYLTAFASGTARPNTSTLNFLRGATVPNTALVPVGADGRIVLYSGTTRPTHLIADVTGYVVTGPATEPGSVTVLPPTRLLDTRTATPLMSPTALRVAGAGGVPATGVTAVILSVTVTAPTTSGWLTVASQRNVASPNPQLSGSNLNFRAGQTVANLVVTPVGADGKIVLVPRLTGRVHVLVDVTGYVHLGALHAAGAVRATSGARLLDTRALGSDPVGPHGTVDVLPFNGDRTRAGNVGAVLLQVTVTATQAAGYLTAWASGTARPLTSSLNWAAGQTVSGLLLAPVGSDGNVSLLNTSSGNVHMIADLYGTALRGPVDDAAGWTATRLPLPAGPDPTSIDDLACDESQTCALALENPSGYVLGHRVGGVWTMTPYVDDYGRPKAVDCGPELCAAAGHDTLSVSVDSGWVTTKAPPPPRSTVDVFSIEDVSCTGDSTCVAAGSFHESPEGIAAYVATFAAGRWTGARLPLPVGKQGGAQFVSCSSSVSCVAGGSVWDLVRVTAVLWSWDGTAWTISNLPLPAGETRGDLESLSCPPTGGCVAVGLANNENDTDPQGVMVRRSASGWAVLAGPHPWPRLTGVSCSASACLAAGSVDAQGGHLYDISATTVVERPLVSAGGGTPDPLAFVSCAADHTCLSWGPGIAGVSDRGAVAVPNESGTWVSASTPTPPGGVESEEDRSSTWTRFGCASSTFCTGVRLYLDDTDHVQLALLSRVP